jgi:hypothetical protein
VTSASTICLSRSRAIFDACERTNEFALIEAITTALRAELGAEIDVQPGYRDPTQAGQVGRAFRVMAEIILRAIAMPQEDLEALTNWALVRLARPRLEAELLDLPEIEYLLAYEPNDRDDWLAFLILTTLAELEQLLERRGSDLN